MMSKYGLYGKLKPNPAKAANWRTILLESGGIGAPCPGCHIYLIGKDAQDGDTVWVTEVWDSKQDHDDPESGCRPGSVDRRAMPCSTVVEGGTVLEVLGSGLE